MKTSIRFALAALLTLLALGVAACSERVTTLPEVEASLKQQGLYLEPYEEKLPPQNVFLMELNGVKPDVFAIKGHMASLYIFQSEKARKAGERDFADQTAAASVVGHGKYAIRNVLLLYVQQPNRDESLENLLEQAFRDMENWK